MEINNNILPLDKLEILIWNKFFSRDGEGTIHELMKIIESDRKSIKLEMETENAALRAEIAKLRKGQITNG